jgi:hypothetical protein
MSARDQGLSRAQITKHIDASSNGCGSIMSIFTNAIDTMPQRRSKRHCRPSPMSLGRTSCDHDIQIVPKVDQIKARNRARSNVGCKSFCRKHTGRFTFIPSTNKGWENGLRLPKNTKVCLFIKARTRHCVGSTDDHWLSSSLRPRDHFQGIRPLGKHPASHHHNLFNRCAASSLLHRPDPYQLI